MDRVQAFNSVMCHETHPSRRYTVDYIIMLLGHDSYRHFYTQLAHPGVPYFMVEFHEGVSLFKG
jgi:hypothetical protein